MKEVTRKTIICFCLPQFAVGLFTTMLNNYLIYFYQPTAASGLPTLITQGYVFAGILTVIGLIKALGHVLDAMALAEKYGKNKYRWDNNVAEFILLKSNEEYYNDPVCKSGYFRGKETYNFVNRVLETSESYKKKIKA